MAYEQKDMSGTLFINDRKDKDTHPDRAGTALIDGVEYWVSGWIKSGQRGQFLSLAFKKKEQRSEPAPPPRRAPPRTHPDERQDPISTGRQGFDEDVPF